MQNSLLLVIDFINEIVHPDGKGSANIISHLEEQHAIAHANQAIAFARQHSLPIAHVKVGFKADYSDCPENSPMFSVAKKHEAFKLGTWGTEFHADLDVQKEDTIIIKNRVSPFFNTCLDSLLEEYNIQQLIICGVSTQMAVESAAKDAHDRDYAVLVLADACASSDADTHQQVLQNLQRIAKITKVEHL
jgi:nicotinamidase-related amidase